MLVWSRAVIFVGVLLGLVAPSAALAVDPPSRSAPQVLPSPLERVFATDNAELDIDGLDDNRVDVDVAIIDTGVQLDHPDLNIVSRTNCVAATWPYSGPDYECANALPSDGDDNGDPGIWHGTWSAANIAALDNGIGTVGIAAGARLWSVDVSGDERYGMVPNPNPLPAPTFNLEAVIAGVKWVTERADQIEIAHIPVICEPENVFLESFHPVCAGTDDVDLVQELEDAIAASMAAGVVYVFSAGANQPADSFVPQRFPNMLITSQMADSDGLPGAAGDPA